eukprot:10875320-Alexandrium_andersonii.AAC.1
MCIRDRLEGAGHPELELDSKLGQELTIVIGLLARVRADSRRTGINSGVEVSTDDERQMRFVEPANRAAE